MQLENKYYQIIDMQGEASNATFHLRLLPDCDVYRGHFPHHAVCPGALNIETIRECVSRSVGKDMRITTIKQCRLTAIATPETCPEMTLTFSLVPKGEGYSVTARMRNAEQVFVEYKGEMRT